MCSSEEVGRGFRGGVPPPCLCGASGESRATLARQSFYDAGGKPKRRGRRPHRTPTLPKIFASIESKNAVRMKSAGLESGASSSSGAAGSVERSESGRSRVLVASSPDRGGRLARAKKKKSKKRKKKQNKRKGRTEIAGKGGGGTFGQGLLGSRASGMKREATRSDKPSSSRDIWSRNPKKRRLLGGEAAGAGAARGEATKRSFNPFSRKKVKGVVARAAPGLVAALSSRSGMLAATAEERADRGQESARPRQPAENVGARANGNAASRSTTVAATKPTSVVWRGARAAAGSSTSAAFRRAAAKAGVSGRVRVRAASSGLVGVGASTGRYGAGGGGSGWGIDGRRRSGESSSVGRSDGGNSGSSSGSGGSSSSRYQISSTATATTKTREATATNSTANKSTKANDDNDDNINNNDDDGVDDDDGDDDDGDGPNAYELARLERIRKNQAMLAALGLLGGGDALTDQATKERVERERLERKAELELEEREREKKEKERREKRERKRARERARAKAVAADATDARRRKRAQENANFVKLDLKRGKRWRQKGFK